MRLYRRPTLPQLSFICALGTYFTLSALSAQGALAEAPEGSACHQEFPQITETAQIRIIASRLNGQLQPEEVPDYMKAFDAREKADQLREFPDGNRKAIPITELMKMPWKSCVAYGYGALLRPGMNRDHREELLLKTLHRSLYFLTDDDKMISHGDDIVEMACLGKVLENPAIKKDLDLRFFQKALKLPHLSASVLTFLVNNLEPSQENLPFYLDAVVNPSMEPHELHHILNDIRRSTLDSESRRKLTGAILSSPAFAQEPAALTIDLMDVPAKEDSAFHYENALLLAQQTPAPVSPFTLVQRALNPRDPEKDYGPLYTALSGALPARKKANMLEYFLTSEVRFPSGHAEILSLWSDRENVGHAFFMNLALSEADKSKFLSAEEITAMLETELNGSQLTEEELHRVISTVGSNSTLSEGQRTQLLTQAVKKGASSSALVRNALNSGYNLMAEKAEQQRILMPVLEAAVSSHLNEDKILLPYEHCVGTLKEPAMILEFSRKLLERHSTSAEFLDNYARTALKDRKHPDFPAAVEILRQENVSRETLVEMATMLKGSFAGKASTPGLEPLLQALEKHSLANDEIKRSVATIRSGGWGKLDPTKLDWNMLEK